MTSSDPYLVRYQGITYDIDWRRWEPGASIFIPCIDAPGIRERVHKEGTHRGIKLMSRVLIKDQYFGVRFWRVT